MCYPAGVRASGRSANRLMRRARRWVGGVETDHVGASDTNEGFRRDVYGSPLGREGGREGSESYGVENDLDDVGPLS